MTPILLISLFEPLLAVFGPWYDHVCGFWEKKQTYANLHYMFFENMVEVGKYISLSIDYTVQMSCLV